MQDCVNGQAGARVTRGVSNRVVDLYWSRHTSTPDAVSSFRFRFVQHGVGSDDRLIDGVSAVVPGNSRAYRYLQGRFGNVEFKLGNLVAQGFGLHEGLRLFDFGTIDDEFLTPQSGNEITFSEISTKRFANLSKDHIPDGMAVDIIDFFEPVDVDHDDHGRFVGYAPLQVKEVAPREGLRQRVIMENILDGLMRKLEPHELVPRESEQGRGQDRRKGHVDFDIRVKFLWTKCQPTHRGDHENHHNRTDDRPEDYLRNRSDPNLKHSHAPYRTIATHLTGNTSSEPSLTRYTIEDRTND